MNPPTPTSTGLIEVAATANSVTFKHQLNPAIASDVNYDYQWSTDLTEWKTTGHANTGGTTASIAASAPDAGNVVTVVITITGGPFAKLFGRLRAQQ